MRTHLGSVAFFLCALRSCRDLPNGSDAHSPTRAVPCCSRAGHVFMFRQRHEQLLHQVILAVSLAAANLDGEKAPPRPAVWSGGLHLQGARYERAVREMARILGPWRRSSGSWTRLLRNVITGVHAALWPLSVGSLLRCMISDSPCLCLLEGLFLGWERLPISCCLSCISCGLANG